MKIILFLGAGASAPFGKPTTLQLKQKLLEKYQYQLEPKFLSSFLLCPTYNDIEHVLQALRDIRQFIDSQKIYNIIFIRLSIINHSLNRSTSSIDTLFPMILSIFFNYFVNLFFSFFG